MTVVAVVLVGLAAWLAVAPPVEPRLGSMLGRASDVSHRRSARPALTWVASACGAIGLVVVLPNAVGILLSAATLVLVPMSLRRLETVGDRRDREALSRQAPATCDLLAATLSSGATLPASLDAVAAALPAPAGQVLRSVHASLLLGADAHTAWAPWMDDPALSLIAAAVVRSERTGAPLATLLSRLAEDLRRERRTVVEVAARSAGVRAVVPLAACFLPAFLLLGVVPVVASLAADLLAP